MVAMETAARGAQLSSAGVDESSVPAVHVQRRVSEVASRGQTMLRLTRSGGGADYGGDRGGEFRVVVCLSLRSGSPVRNVCKCRLALANHSGWHDRACDHGDRGVGRVSRTAAQSPIFLGNARRGGVGECQR